VNIDSENQALKLIYSLRATGDEVFDEEMNQIKLSQWKGFEVGSRTDSIYVNPEFQDNSYLIFTISNKWLIARKWLIKEEWNSKTVVHPIKKVRDAHKPIGELLMWYWWMAERCYSLQESSGTSLKVFENAGRLFSRIFVEIVLIDLVHALHPSEKNYYNNLKMGWLEIERERLRQLKKGENPFNKYVQTCGLKMLIDCAISLANCSDQFEKKFWKKYLKAYSDYIQRLNNPEWGRLYVENGKCYTQSGRGRGGTGRTFIGTVEDYKKLISGSIAQ